MNTTYFSGKKCLSSGEFFHYLGNYNIYEDGETPGSSPEPSQDADIDTPSDAEKNVVKKTQKLLGEVKSEVEGGQAGTHATLETDSNPDIGKSFYKEKRRGEKWSAKAAYHRGELDNFLSNRSEINDLQQDKIAIAEDMILDKIKGDLKDAGYSRSERGKIYKANALKFINDWDTYITINHSYPSSITINIPYKNGTMNNYTFSDSEYPIGFKTLKKKDEKISSLSLEAIEKKRKFDKANKDAKVSKEELITEGLTKKEAKKIIKHIEKAEYRDEKAKEHNEAMNTRYKLYASEIMSTMQGDTSTVRYNVDKNKGRRNRNLPRWIVKTAEKKKLSIEETKTLTNLDKLSIIFCDYNMDGDITPKALKKDFRTKTGGTLEGEYKQASGSENSYTITASELRESIEIAKAEVGDIKLVENMKYCMNTILPQNKQISDKTNSVEGLLNLVAMDFAYVDAFRRSILSFPNNVTDLLTLGNIGELYKQEKKEIITFNTLKAREIEKQLATLNLETVDGIWRNIENDSNLSVEEKKVIQAFRQNVTSQASTQVDLRLKYLQDIQKNNPPTNPQELEDLNKEIAALQGEDAKKHVTLSGIMAFMMGNYQGLTEHVHKHTDGTTTIERGYYRKTKDGASEFVKLANNKDSFKDVIKRTTLDAFGIGAGGTLVDLGTVGRFANNLSRGASASSALQSVPGSFDPNTVSPGQAANNDYTKRGYTLGISVGYNASEGLGHRIGNTNYYPATIYAGAGLSAGYNTIIGWHMGGYAYAGIGWTRNAGKLQHTLSAKPVFESSLTGVAGFTSKSLLGADLLLTLGKNHIKGFEMIADNIQTIGTPMIDDILNEISLQTKKQITKDRLIAIIRGHILKKNILDKYPEPTVINRISNNIASMIEQLHPGLSNGEGIDLHDINNKEERRIIAQDLCFNLSLNRLNENYDKLEGFDLTGITIPATSIALILGSIACAPVSVAGVLMLVAANTYSKNKVQEEHGASRYTAEQLREYNIGARTLEKKDLGTEVGHINNKINILFNTLGIAYVSKTKDGKNIILHNNILDHPTVFPVYLNPKYQSYYQTIEQDEKNAAGLMVPANIASGILTMVGKEKQGALYIGYTANDHHMFYNTDPNDPNIAKNPEQAILWKGQKFTGKPEQYKVTNTIQEDSIKNLLAKPSLQGITKLLDFKIQGTTVTISAKSGVSYTEGKTINILGKKLVFTQSNDTTITLKVEDGTTDNCTIEYNYKEKTTEHTEKEIPIDFNYASVRNFEIDPNTQRGRIKSLKSYKSLAYEMDRGAGTNRAKAATYANQIISDYNKIYNPNLTITPFQEDNKEDIVQFLHKLIGSKYCDYDGTQKVNVGKGSSFSSLMTERLSGFKERWNKDTHTKSIQRADLENSRNNSLANMFRETTIGLTIDNYMNKNNPNKYSFATEKDSGMIGFVYGYGGEHRTHDEKLVLNPDIVSHSEYAINSIPLKKYAVSQIKDRYDAVYGINAFIQHIGDKIGKKEITETDIQKILDGDNSMEINGGTLTVTPQFFFYPDCFNEAIGCKILFKTNEEINKENDKKVTETGTIKEAVHGETGFFVNNINIGMTSTKDALGIGIGAGMKINPDSRTTTTTTKQPDSTTEVQTTPLDEISGVDIKDKTIVVNQNGYNITIAPLNGTNGKDGYIFLDANGNLVNGSMKDIIDKLGTLNQNTINNLNAYDKTMQGPQFVTTPGAITTTTTKDVFLSKWTSAVSSIGFKDALEEIKTINAVQTGNPEATGGTRDTDEQQRRTYGRVAPL